METANKAHTATVNRIARRYGADPVQRNEADVETEQLTVEVETTATIPNGIQRLNQHPGAVYIAVTNKEAVKEALQLTEGTRVGVMNPHGDIIKDSPALEVHQGSGPGQ